MTKLAIRMIFKALFDRFFGLSEKSTNYPYYTRLDHRNGWDILCGFIHTVLATGSIITPALLVLKLIGIFDRGWFMVFLPLLTEAGWSILQDLANMGVYKVKDRREKEYWQERFELDQPKYEEYEPQDTEDE